MFPASHSYFMSIDKPTVVLKCFFGNSLSEFVDVVSCFATVKARIQ